MHQENQVKTGPAILLFLALVPAFFFGIRNSHDWGDDYAMYIGQSECILQGKPQTATGFIYQEYGKGMGPRAYPSGFPLLLAGAGIMGAHTVQHYLIYLSCWYALWCLLCIIFFRKNLSFVFLLAVLLLSFYNLEILRFKSEIMSEIPFACFTMLAFIGTDHYLRQKKWAWLLVAACMAGFAICIRSIGIVMLPAAFVYMGWRKKLWKPAFVYILAAGAFYYLVNHLIFSIPASGSYTDQLVNFKWEYFRQNLERYVFVAGNAITGGHTFPTWIHIFLSCFFLLAFMTKLVKKPGLVDYYIIFYYALLLIYPQYQHRFFYPLYPVCIFYMGWMLRFMVRSAGRTIKITGVVLSIIAGIYTVILLPVNIKKEWTYMHQPVDGATDPLFREMVIYIREEIPVNEGISFIKPRLLALETGHPCMLLPDTAAPGMYTIMKKNGIRHCLIFSQGWDYQQPIERMARDTSYMEPEFSNSRFGLYRLKEKE